MSQSTVYDPDMYEDIAASLTVGTDGSKSDAEADRAITLEPEVSKPSHAEAVKHDFGLGAENPVVEERRREETTADGSAQSPAAGMAEKLAAGHGSRRSPQETTASSLHRLSETDAFEGLSRKLADQEARMGRFEEENSHIKYLLWNMGDWLVDLGDHLKETGKTLKREAGRREGDEDKEAATGKKRKKTHSA
ncbi:hypothetical protein BU26DRAFT_558902 [Trematosphaeria pertusa]|uniref:Uncharacterized protein n=1 Tax=Trematosphaeria pertusa TaxID=390896 RepID=A0A6A6IUR1_9PLEO|nr:uncharacterized protein BU26DRAFT_558902 [Trematosphaeria pertusa]KAF2254184.1 hypothetical protein BU26DRAFT_558902 [Trematosphaeria pertusa]